MHSPFSMTDEVVPNARLKRFHKVVSCYRLDLGSVQHEMNAALADPIPQPRSADLLAIKCFHLSKQSYTEKFIGQVCHVGHFQS